MHRRLRVLVGVTSLAVVLLMMPTVAVQAIGVPETLSFRAPVGAGPVEPGFPVDHLGVLWDDPGGSTPAEEAHDHGAVRFRHDGVWGPWTSLEKDGASGEGLWASGLLAGDGAEAYQVRGLPADARAPRSVAFNTTDGPLRTTRVVPTGAQAIENVACMSRAEWGADESLRGRVDANPFPAQVMTLHHTATSNGDDDPAGTVRAIYHYHTVDNDWDDIGYHYLVSEDGTVFEGVWSGELGETYEDDTYSQRCDSGGTGADFAHMSTDDDALVARGAHVGGYNTGNIGVALLGTFTERGRKYTNPQPAAVDAAEQVLAELSARHDIDPQAIVKYANLENEITVDAISGHRDYNATECPGDRLYILLPQIRSDVADLVANPPDPGDAPPIVTLTSPASGVMVAGELTVTADAGDDVGVDQVQFAVDGVALSTDSDGEDGWSAAWNTVTVEDGPHTVSATATDTAGQTATSSVDVTVANDPAPPATVHVADLDGSSASERSTWSAVVTVTVATAAGDPAVGATVTGIWSTGETGSCVTGADGTCTAELSGIGKRTGSVGFAVTDVSAGQLEYDPSANTDPDGDSDGTTIVVPKP